MEKLFTSSVSPFVLLFVGLGIGISLATENLQQVAAGVGMTGLALGMTKQAVMQYKNGKCGVHWILNTIMLVALVLRGAYMVRTGQYWLAIPDIYGVVVMGFLQLQLAGLFLKKSQKS